MASCQQPTLALGPITHRSSGSNQHIMNNKDHGKRNDLMKFMELQRPNRLEGKRCFSNNTAVSKDFPEHFQRLNTTEKIIPHFTTNPQQKRMNNTSQCFYPHKNYFHVAKQAHQLNNEEFVHQYNKTIQLCQHPFNRKISQYSGFIQQNVSSLWGKQYPLMGFERSKQARKAQHSDRDKIIDEKQKTRQTFLRTFLTKNNNQRSNKRHQNQTTKEFIRTNNDLLFGLRTKVRKNRNQIANQLHLETQSYLIKDTNSIETLQPYHSTESYKRNHSSYERPLTSLQKHKSILPSRTEMFDGLLSKHGQVYKINSHSKSRSSVENMNIVAETSQQMNIKLQEWSKINGNKFIPTTKIIKDMDKIHKGQKSTRESKFQSK